MVHLRVINSELTLQTGRKLVADNVDQAKNAPLAVRPVNASFGDSARVTKVTKTHSCGLFISRFL